MLIYYSNGALFRNALYIAACLGKVDEGLFDASNSGNEDLTNETFKFPNSRLSVDYISYVMFSLMQRKP